MDFRLDGWKVGHYMHVIGAPTSIGVDNNAKQGTISAISSDGHTLTFSDVTWDSQTVSNTLAFKLFTQTGDTENFAIEHCAFDSGPLINPGEGQRALVSLNAAIFSHVRNSYFGTAERGIVFCDNSQGLSYSNGNSVYACNFGLQGGNGGLTGGAFVNAGQRCTALACGVEGLGGFMSVYRDEFPLTKAAIDRTFTYDPNAKTITASSGDFAADGWANGMAISTGTDVYFFDLGTVTNVAPTVLTVSGTVPSIMGAGPVRDGWYVWNDDGDTGTESRTALGNTLTVSGTTITRSDGLSFIDDGWIIGMNPLSPSGGGYPGIIGVTDDTLTLDSSVASNTYTSDFHIWYRIGGSFSFNYGWVGDQFRNDSHFHMCSGRIELTGNDLYANARVLSCFGGPLAGVIEGNTVVSLKRPREAYLFEGTSGAVGFKVDGNGSGLIRHRTVNNGVDFSMEGNRFLEDGVGYQVKKQSYDYKTEIYERGLKIITRPGNSTTDTNAKAKSPLDVDGAVATVTRLYAFVDGDTGTLSDKHSTTILDARSGNMTRTLPQVSTCPGRVQTIKRPYYDTSTNTVTILPHSGDTIDGDTSYLLPMAGSYVVLQADADIGYWLIVGAG
jgi:hypothetical protein